MRIATWNMDVRPRPAKVELLLALEADVLLLTEVPEGLELPGYFLTPPGGRMLRGQLWAAIASRRPLEPLPSQHIATTVARVDDMVYACSVLPWKGAPQDPWLGSTTGERMCAAVEAIEASLRQHEQLIWGGDWNQTLSGRLAGSTRAGRERLQEACNSLRLHVPTSDSPRGAYPMASIDHIAVGDPAAVAEHISVDRRLSDHDAYVVTVHT